MHASALAQKGSFPAGHPSLVRQGLGRRSGWHGMGMAQTLASGATVLIFRGAPGGAQTWLRAERGWQAGSELVGTLGQQASQRAVFAV